jgi:hypothetical protein
MEEISIYSSAINNRNHCVDAKLDFHAYSLVK